MGCGIQKGAGEMYRGAEIDATLLPKVKIEVVVSKIPVDSVIATAKKVLFTGHIGDGKIFVYNVDRVVKVRTGEENNTAKQSINTATCRIKNPGLLFQTTGGRDFYS